MAAMCRSSGFARHPALRLGLENDVMNDVQHFSIRPVVYVAATANRVITDLDGRLSNRTRPARAVVGLSIRRGFL